MHARRARDPPAGSRCMGLTVQCSPSFGAAIGGDPRSHSVSARLTLLSSPHSRPPPSPEISPDLQLATEPCRWTAGLSTRHLCWLPERRSAAVCTDRRARRPRAGERAHSCSQDRARPHMPVMALSASSSPALVGVSPAASAAQFRAHSQRGLRPSQRNSPLEGRTGHRRRCGACNRRSLRRARRRSSLRVSVLVRSPRVLALMMAVSPVGDSSRRCLLRPGRRTVGWEWTCAAPSRASMRRRAPHCKGLPLGRLTVGGARSAHPAETLILRRRACLMDCGNVITRRLLGPLYTGLKVLCCLRPPTSV